MITPLRRVHRRTFFALALVVPAVLGWAAAIRRPVAQGETAQPVAEHGARIVGDEIELVSDASQKFPDVLVYYWDRENGTPGVGDGAEFLGRSVGDGSVTERFTLPVFFRLRSGDKQYVVLYSLGHQEVVATFELGAPTEEGGE